MAKEIKFVERYIVFTCEKMDIHSDDLSMRCVRMYTTFEEAQEFIRTNQQNDVYRFHIMKVTTTERIEQEDAKRASDIEPPIDGEYCLEMPVEQEDAKQTTDT